MLTAKRKFRPKNYTKHFKKVAHLPLSPNEEKAKEALRSVTHDSVYGMAIRDAFVGESEAKFRQLFSELLSQMADNDMLMLKILGKTAYDALLKIKPNE